jgi:hypothetical protein
VRPGYVESEGLGPLHELADVGITAPQVSDELTAQGLLPRDQLLTRVAVPSTRRATASSTACSTATRPARPRCRGSEHSVERWLLVGDDGGHDPDVFADVVGLWVP